MPKVESGKQKVEVIDKLWKAGNVVTGYGVVQAVAIALAMSNSNQRCLLLSVWYALAPIFAVIGAFLAVLVRNIGGHELRMRKELGADGSVVGTVRKALG